MTDPTNSVAEQAAPEAVRWAVNVHRVARQRQDKIQADIAAMDAKLAELSKYAAEIASNRAAASEELEKVTLDADVAMEMAMSACRTHGWTLPEPQGEPPLNQTGAFPAVQPQDATQVIPVAEVCCVCGASRVVYHNYKELPFCGPCADGSGTCENCDTEIQYLPDDDRGWHHKATGNTSCGNGKFARPRQPDEAAPAIPGLQGIRTGEDVIVRLKDGGQQPGRITHIIPGGFNVAYGTKNFPVRADDIESVEPADLDQETASPAVTTPDEVRTDG